jgi:hypothetical protein
LRHRLRRRATRRIPRGRWRNRLRRWRRWRRRSLSGCRAGCHHSCQDQKSASLCIESKCFRGSVVPCRWEKATGVFGLPALRINRTGGVHGVTLRGRLMSTSNLPGTACRSLCPNASSRRAHPANDQLGRHSTYVRTLKIVKLLTLKAKDRAFHDYADMDAFAVEYIAVHADLLSTPLSKDCACWPGIARQIAGSNYFPFTFSPI